MPIEIANDFSPNKMLALLSEHCLNPSFTGAYRLLVNEDRASSDALQRVLNGGDCPIQAFRLIPVKLQSKEGPVMNYVLCPDTEVLSNPTDYGFLLLRHYKACHAKSIVAQNLLISLISNGDRWKVKKLEGPRLWAYFLPYHNERPQKGDDPEDVIGYVDFPKNDPCCPYVITGQMNGCHLVVSESPHQGHLRAWHYQSPGANPVFTRDNFPYKVIAWLKSSDYIGQRLDVDVCGFNFLYFQNEKWSLFSQPQALGPPIFDKIWGSYVAVASSKKPFAVALE